MISVFVYFEILLCIQYIHPSPLAVVPLHLLIADQLSGKNLPGVPSRVSNSGLPYSKPTHYHIKYYALCLKVPKREIFDRSDFPDFYTIKSSGVGDLVVKILTYYFNF